MTIRAIIPTLCHTKTFKSSIETARNMSPCVGRGAMRVAVGTSHQSNHIRALDNY